MKFQPTPEEESVGITHIDNGSYDLNSTALAVPGSEWNDVHLKALRVVLLDGLPVSRLFLVRQKAHVHQPSLFTEHRCSLFLSSAIFARLYFPKSPCCNYYYSLAALDAYARATSRAIHKLLRHLKNPISAACS